MSAGATRRFRADIQGLRAVAVGVVLLYHAGVPWLPGGYVGVDVFFVISGFLITGHLLAERQSSGTVRLRAFYARRIRRLLPASSLVFVTTLALAAIMLPPLALRDVSKDGIAAALYASNIRFASVGADYLANDAPSVFQHFWSLAVEEQFYFVWPLLLLVASRRSRRAVVPITIVIGILSIASFLFCVVSTQRSQPWGYFTLPSRAWELGLGALLALGSDRIAVLLRPVAAAFIGWAGLAAIVATSMVYDERTLFPGTAAVVPVLGAVAVVGGGLAPHRAGPQILLGLRPMRFVGDISYSLYLWHWPLLTLPAMYTLDPPGAWERAGIVVLSVALAWLSYRFVEQRFSKSAGHRTEPTARRAPRLRVAYAIGAVLTLLSVGSAVAIGRVDVGGSGTPGFAWPIGTPPGDVPVPRSVPSDLEPALLDAGGSVPSTYANGCHVDLPVVDPPACEYGDTSSDQVVVLFGDSHAAQWFPALDIIAANRGVRLVTLTKSDCPSAEVRMFNSDLARHFTECDDWREAAFDRISSLDPVMIVVANYQVQTLVTQGDLEAEWAAGLHATIARLPAGRSVVLSDSPTFPIQPAICLSAHLDDVAACAQPRAAAIDARRMATERAATTDAGGRYVDTSSWTCDVTCPVVRGNVLLYRDRNHMTTQFVERLAPLLDHALWP